MKLLAKHLRQVYFGGNWTASHVEQQLADVTWQEATMQVYGLNSIATLTFHINYYVEILIKAIQENKLEGSDKLSFNCPTIQSAEAWERLVQSAKENATQLADLIESFPDERLEDVFFVEKYGDYYRNFIGLIEHTHYHLGQIAILKKILKYQVIK